MGDRPKAAAVLLLAVLARATASAEERGAAAFEGWRVADATGIAPLSTALPEARLSGTASEPARLAAVEEALAWLAAHQAPDGAFHPAELHWCDGKKRDDPPPGPGNSLYAAGVTGLALSAFAAGGHDHLGGPFAGTVRRALDWLASVQDAEGCFGSRDHTHFTYSHGYATRGMLEVFLLSGDSSLRLPLQRALDFVVHMANPAGGWRYGVKPGEVDVSVTGLHVLTLLLAWEANQAAADRGRREPLRVPGGLSPTGAVARGLAAADARTDEWGRTGYMTRGSGPARTAEMVDKFPAELSEAMTAVALAARALLPEPLRRERALAESMEKQVALIDALRPVWNPPAIDLYYWTYATLALARLGGPAWKAWDESLAAALLPHQRKDGSRCEAKGSWDPVDPWAADGGRMYTTAMAVLCLAPPTRRAPAAAESSAVVRALGRDGTPPAALRRLLRTVGVHAARGAEAAALRHAAPPSPAAVRAEVALALASPGPSRAGAAALETLLRDPDPWVRLGALGSLASLPASQPALGAVALESVAHADPNVRREAIVALASLAPPPPGFADALRKAVADADPSVRAVAAAVGARTTPPVEGASAALAEALRGTGPSATDALRAARGLRSLDPDVRTALRARLESPDAETRVRAAALLHAGSVEEKPDPNVVLALVTGLRHPTYEVREAALAALEARPADAEGLADACDAVIEDGPRTLRVAAIRAYARAQPRRALAALHVSATDADPEVAKAAREALASTGIPVPEQAEALAVLLEGDDHRAVAAARALVSLGAGATDALRARLADPATTPAVRRACLGVVRRMGSPAKSLEPVVAAIVLKETVAGDAMAAAAAWASVGGRDPKVAQRLAEWSSSDDAAVARQAVTALASAARNVPAAEEPLLRIARSKRSSDLRAAALAGLAQVAKPKKETLAEVVLLLAEEEWAVVDGAERVVEAAGKPGVAALANLLAVGNDARRLAALRAVSKLGPKAKAARGAVAKLLGHENPFVAGEAQQALAAIDEKKK
jgi:hypothetical protein